MSESNYQFPTQVNKLEPAPLGTKLKTFFLTSVFFGGFIYGVLWLIMALFSLNWLLYVNYTFTGLIFLLGIYMAVSAQTAKCPYCDADLGKGEFDALSKDDVNTKLECNHCHQWLISNNGEVRSYTFDDVKGRKTFDAPVLNGGVWPDCCIVCGGEVTRVGEAKKDKVNWGALLAGRISVSSGSIKNIPYCEDHFGQVEVTIKDDHLRLKFTDFKQLLRYLEANGKGKKPVKCS